LPNASSITGQTDSKRNALLHHLSCGASPATGITEFGAVKKYVQISLLLNGRAGIITIISFLLMLNCTGMTNLQKEMLNVSTIRK
jgi:hypothetical protein